MKNSTTNVCCSSKTTSAERNEFAKKYIDELKAGNRIHENEFAQIHMELCEINAKKHNFEFSDSYQYEEFCNDLFLHVIKKIASYNAECAFSTWFKNVELNFYKDLWRKNKNSKETLGSVIFAKESDDKENSLDDFLSMQVARENVELEVIDNDLNHILHNEFCELNENQQRVLHLHIIEEYTLKEIAEMMNTSMTNVANWLWRGKESLRKRIEETGLADQFIDEMVR